MRDTKAIGKYGEYVDTGGKRKKRGTDELNEIEQPRSSCPQGRGKAALLFGVFMERGYKGSSSVSQGHSRKKNCIPWFGNQF